MSIIFRLDKCAEQGIVVFNTPGANANGVKELVIAGMLLAARDIVGGIHWVQENEEDGDIAKKAEKAEKTVCRNRDLTERNWVSSVLEQSVYVVANAATASGNGCIRI